MNNKTASLIFALGVAVGASTSWYLVKAKYERIANEEIESVREIFSRQKDERSSLDVGSEVVDNAIQEVANTAKDKINVIDYAAAIKDLGYTSNKHSSNETEVAEMREDFLSRNPKPYVISPSEFSEFEDYDVISITYYADKILADDNDEVIEDIEGVVGFESLTTFGQYDDDAVFVRNERLQTDFEVLLDDRKYLDVLESKPYLAEE